MPSTTETQITDEWVLREHASDDGVVVALKHVGGTVLEGIGKTRRAALMELAGCANRLIDGVAKAQTAIYQTINEDPA